MSEMIRVVVDAMGGDYAPVEPVKGAIEAVNASAQIYVILTGDKGKIEAELAKYEFPADRVEIVHTTEVIETGEPPVQAILGKKDSSLVVGMNMIRHGDADALVSSGSTGAILVGGQTIVGRIRGVQRPPLGALIPTRKGFSLLLDCGANVDIKADTLVQFAKMGTIYMEKIVGVKNPTVGLVNIGVEEEKGNALCKAAYPMLKENPNINFIGNVEAREIPYGAADIIVAEAFVGNVVLKMYEGVSGALVDAIKEGLMDNLRSKLGALLIKPALKKTMKGFDTSDHGGAPLLGLKGLVVKTHGSSKATEFKNSVLQCIAFKEQNITQVIQENLKA